MTSWPFSARAARRFSLRMVGTVGRGLHGQPVQVDRLHRLAEGPLQVGVIGRLTEIVLIPSGQGRVRIVSPHELPVGEV